MWKELAVGDRLDDLLGPVLADEVWRSGRRRRSPRTRRCGPRHRAGAAAGRPRRSTPARIDRTCAARPLEELDERPTVSAASSVCMVDKTRRPERPPGAPSLRSRCRGARRSGSRRDPVAERGAAPRRTTLVSSPTSRSSTMQPSSQWRISIGSSIVTMCWRRAPVDVAEHRRERRRLADAGRPGDEDEAHFFARFRTPWEISANRRSECCSGSHGRRTIRRRAAGRRPRGPEARWLVGRVELARLLEGAEPRWGGAADVVRKRRAAPVRAAPPSRAWSAPSRRTTGGRPALKVDIAGTLVDGGLNRLFRSMLKTSADAEVASAGVAAPVDGRLSRSCREPRAWGRCRAPPGTVTKALDLPSPSISP